MLIIAFVVIRFNEDPSAEADLRQGMGGSGQGVFDDNGTFTPDQDPATVGVVRNETGAEPEDRSLRFLGIGSQDTAPFSVSGGVLRLDFSFEGRNGIFGVKVFQPGYGADDQANESVLVPEFGQAEGSHHIALAPGEYVLSISTGGDDASWSVRLTYPDSSDAVSGKIVGFGIEARVLGLAEGDQELHFQASSEGESFEVEIFDWRGDRLPETTCGASGYGGYDRVKTCRIPAAGPYFVNVIATSSWSITP